MPTKRDLLRIAAKSALLTIALWVIFLTIGMRFDWPLYAPIFTIIWIVPMTISAGSIQLTSRQRVLIIFGVCVVVTVLTFATTLLIYPTSTPSLRGLLGALILGAIIGILSTLVVPRLRGSSRLLSAIVALVIAATPSGLSAQKHSLVIASVADASSGAPLENAEVRLVDARMAAQTDWSGEARISEVPQGRYKFEVRHPGYAVLYVDLLVEGDSTGPVFRLASIGPVPSLEPVTVNALRPTSPLKDFETRRGQGIGKFLTADELAAQSNRSLMSIVVQAFNGLMATPDPEQTSRIILMTRRQDARLDLNALPEDKHYLYESHCGVDIYLDGSQFKDDLDTVKPGDLAAVEYYPMSSAPGQYRRLSENCGVLLLWSKK
jgi:hypothetical protein